MSGSVDDGVGALDSNLVRIAGLLLNEETLHTVLGLVVELTAEAIAGADGCSVTMISSDGYSSPAYSSEFVLEIDRIQYAKMDGPCISAAEERRVRVVHDLRTEGRWPDFSEAAARHGIRSVLAIPFIPMESVVGALNIYSLKTEAFGDEHVKLAGLIAHQAGTVLAHSQASTDAELMNGQLHEALISRDVIGQAKGILMERERVDAEGAFEILRRASQQTNRKLRDIAQDVVDSITRTG